MITGSIYLLRGRRVRAITQWNGKANPGLPRLRALLPLVSTRPNGPRNVAIADPETGELIAVRPFRGLTRLPDTNTPTT